MGKRATTKSGIDIDTGARGLSYLQKELALGGLMSKLLVERVALERGRVITRAHQHSDLPEDFDSDLEPDVSRLQWALATQTVVDFLKSPITEWWYLSIRLLHRALNGSQQSPCLT